MWRRTTILGAGPVSAKSDVVTPVGPPAVPTGVAAVAGPGAGEATVSWVAPTDVGGSPITGFDVQKLNTTARGSGVGGRRVGGRLGHQFRGHGSDQGRVVGVPGARGQRCG